MYAEDDIKDQMYARLAAAMDEAEMNGMDDEDMLQLMVDEMYELFTEVSGNLGAGQPEED